MIEGATVPGAVVERLSQPQAHELFPSGPDVDLPALRERVGSVRKRIDLVTVEFADDPDVSPAQLRVMTRRLRAQLADAEQELTTAGARSVLAPALAAPDVAAWWAGLDTEQRRPIVAELFTVTLQPVGQGARRFDPGTIRVEPRARVDLAVVQ